MMNDSQTRIMSRVVKRYDKDLCAKRNRSGIITIMRKSKRLELVTESAGSKVYYVRDSLQYVFALSDNWATSGHPINWGGEVVVQRLRQHDSQANDRILEDIEALEASQEASENQDMRNQTEAWLADNHSKFKKAFGDVRTANFDKSDHRRRMADKNKLIKET